MKKKLNFYILKNFIIIIIFFSIIKSTDSLKKIYLINKNDYEARINKSYIIKTSNSVPFLHLIKKKYDLIKNIVIYDYSISPNNEWVLFNLNQPIDKKKLILLNYKKVRTKVRFVKLSNGYFVGDLKPPYLYTIKKVVFETKTKINKVNLKIINIAENEKQILFSKKLVFKNGSNEVDLNFDLEKSAIRLGKLFIEINNDENNLTNVKAINFEITPKFELKNFKIIERFADNYLLEKIN